MSPRLHVLVLSCIALSAFSGCNARKLESTTSPIELTLSDRSKLVLDPELNDEERALLVSDLDKTSKLQLTAEPKSYFGKTFGSGDVSGVIRYFSDRVHYILPESVSLDSRISVASMLPDAGGGLYIMASNIGTALWFENLVSAPHVLQFKVGDTQVPLTTARTGIMRLGQGYTVKRDGKYLFSQLSRIATLVHEARHSDCTGGIHRADLEKISDGELPENHSCGHLHVRCPEGHPYEGAFACDSEAWGAYSVEAMFTAALVKNCSNCSDEEQKTALMIFADSLSRVIPKDDMMSGKLGFPDMSSSDEVH